MKDGLHLGQGPYVDKVTKSKTCRIYEVLSSGFIVGKRGEPVTMYCAKYGWVLGVETKTLELVTRFRERKQVDIKPEKQALTRSSHNNTANYAAGQFPNFSMKAAQGR